MQRIFRLVAFALLVLLGESAAAQPNDGKADPAASIAKDAMVFYVAKGDTDACGEGCGEWIAAEGTFDLNAPRRLRTLVTGLGGRKLPIFFHSPGGFLPPAVEIGRLLRGRDMTAGVFKTVPADCIAVSEEDCRTLKASGRAGESKLHNLAVCSSACVFALIGAKYRKVPAWAWIGVHSSKRYEADLSGYHRAVLNARVARYYERWE